jgi:tetratricopeptide (TPR) repeat protein
MLDPELREALALQRQGGAQEAERRYRVFLSRHPRHFDALHLLGVLKLQAGRYKEAAKLLGDALKQYPGAPDALCNLGVARERLGELREAIEAYDRALALDPRYADAFYNRGNALRALGLNREAVESYDCALALDPRDAAALNNRGNALVELGRFEAALESYERALALDPDDAEKHYNRARSLQDLGRAADAVASYDQAIALRPDYPEALINRGTALEEAGRHREALQSYLQVVAAHPDNADAHWNEALVRLLLGDFRGGWEKYEWRWRKKGFTSPKRNFRQPQWRGEAVSGKTVLAHAEQGYGDTINFCRYVKTLAERGARVIFEVQPELKALLAKLEGPQLVIGKGDAIPKFDLHCPLMSLPLALGLTLENVSGQAPYLSADEGRVAAWSEKLGPKRRRRIGVAWSGNTTQKNNRNRAIPVSALRPLLELDAEFVSLQKIVSDEDARQLENFPTIRQCGPELRDFSDTAALISLLDLVISVDTSVPHLAGAMGKPVWILVSYVADWRWFLEGEDSPWYPSARLFRQRKAGRWEGVVERVVDALGSPKAALSK